MLSNRFSTEGLVYHKLFTCQAVLLKPLSHQTFRMSDFTIPELLIKRSIAQENKVLVISCDID